MDVRVGEVRAQLGHPDGDLVGPGLGNLVAPFFGGIAATGGVAQAVAYKEFVKADPGRAKAEEALRNAQAELARAARLSPTEALRS